MGLTGCKKELYVQCISHKYGNFGKYKVYKAVASFIDGYGRYTGYRVTDEDGDYYTLSPKDIGRTFIIVGGTE